MEDLQGLKKKRTGTRTASSDGDGVKGPVVFEI
jgi:hypothetical protein